ncbi:MAG: C39 family peptidase [Clostridiales bacterium]|nr:C39 family peptidase [Clostridiales bacterium]
MNYDDKGLDLDIYTEDGYAEDRYAEERYTETAAIDAPLPRGTAARRRPRPDYIRRDEYEEFPEEQPGQRDEAPAPNNPPERNAQTRRPLPAVKRPAYTMVEEDLKYIYPESNKNKILRIGIMLVAVFTVLYLCTNTLGDTLSNYSAGLAAPLTNATQEPSAATPGMDYINYGAYDMDDPVIAALVNLFEEYPNTKRIADNSDRIPTRLVELAAKNNETIDYVADYLLFGNTGAHASQIDISDELVSGDIPHFVQWDPRWGYSYYGGEVMGLDGCGPTALAMVAAGLTGNAMYNPRFVADYSQENGYINENNDTAWTLMSVGSTAFGITPRELTLDENVIKSALNNGQPIVAAMRAGDFTTGGHFIVMVGVSSGGNILIRDSNSYANTEKEWEYDRIKSQISNLWAFTLS